MVLALMSSWRFPPSDKLIPEIVTRVVYVRHLKISLLTGMRAETGNGIEIWNVEYVTYAYITSYITPASSYGFQLIALGRNYQVCIFE